MDATPILTIADLVGAAARRAGGIEDVEGSRLVGAELENHVIRLAESLGAAGLAGARIAVALPNGPGLAVALLATMAAGTAAPLNPSYRTPEFRALLQDLDVAALLVDCAGGRQAANAARSLGIPVLQVDPRQPGSLAIDRADRQAMARRRGRRSDGALAHDAVLLLHTSGTTARPKIVPLTEQQLCLVANNIVATLALSPTDRCLNVMPLFHVHGLVAGVLSSLLAGSIVVCAPQFDALRFLRWMQKARPSWYTAVPSIHQSVVAVGGPHRQMLSEMPLRFIRSCSAPLPQAVLTELEAVFGVPVIEAYGMTEAAHQLASNPLPPKPRKAGSVGLAIGGEIEVMPEGGATLLPRGALGEIVVRGEAVIAGYEADPEANRAAFCNGWFRTGDQGCIDADGYVWIRGRLKELINRGGEKISPVEIEMALLSHPAVASAAAFPISDSLMGEEIGAAVVLNAGSSASEKELREHCVETLADFKIPRSIHFLPAIPRGATGKVQRARLAVELGLA